MFKRSRSHTRLDDLLIHWAEHQPLRKAFTELDPNGEEVASVTYAELEARSQIVAQEVQSRVTAKRPQHAMLAYPPGVDFMIAFFGCIRAGAVPAPVPLPKRNRPNLRLAQIARSADITMLLSTADTLTWIPPLLDAEPDWPSGVDVWATDTIVAAGPTIPPGTLLPRDAGRRAELAFLQFTSGSTSSPKGVMITHGGCLDNLKMMAAISQLGPASVVVTWLPHYHDLGLVAHLLHSFYCGSHCVILSPAAIISQPSRWLHAVGRYRAQYTGGPNFSYQLCIDRIPPAERPFIDLSSLEVAVNAAEPINPQTVKDFCEAFAVSGFRPHMVQPAYGMAEATVFITSCVKTAEPVFMTVDADTLSQKGVARAREPGNEAKTLVGCGSACLDEDIRIVDSHSRIELPRNHVGEVWVAGPHLMAGYYKNPQATADALTRLPGRAGTYLRTGDLGFLDDNAELYITGRIKDLIIVNGANYYPHDIEHCAELSHPQVRHAGVAAFGITQGASEKLVLFAEVDKDIAREAQTNPKVLEPLAERICAAVGEQFELAVSHILFLKPMQLPKTSSGKVRRQECKTRFLDGSVKGIAAWPFANTKPTIEEDLQMLNIEKALARVASLGPTHLKVFSLLTQILTNKHQIRLADFDIEKSIFFYGIDSLNIISIHAELEEKMQCTIPTAAFFRANTFIEMIDDIVAGISQKGALQAGLADAGTLRQEIERAVDDLSGKLSATAPSAAVGASGKTLLTGASGFVGVALLKEILERTNLKVVCMVRAADEAAALKRIRNTSSKYDLRLPAGFEQRIEIMIGDMSKKGFGLAKQQYQAYAAEIDSVYHCAAVDNFYLPYSVLRSTNVLGSVEVLDFALTAKIKPMYYISSCAVSMLDRADEETKVVGLVNGYAQTKYVTEQIVLRLADKGYPAASYRLGYLYSLRVQEVNDRMSFNDLLAEVNRAYSSLDDSLFVDSDAFENFLMVISKIGACPNVDVDFDLTPVEYAAKAIVASSLMPLESRKTTYSFYNPQPLKWRDVISFFRKNNKKVEVVPLDEFIRRYEAYIRKTDVACEKLLKSVVSADLELQLNTMFRETDIDHVETFKAWCPPCDARFTHAYLDFVVNR
jgi:thioester reductase-like protein